MSVHGLEPAQVRDHVGSLAQVARIDRFVEDDGVGRGARRFRMVTGGGLEVDLHPDRALDVGQVTIDGIPVAWMSAGGITAPGFYDPHGTGWLRTFGGGLLTTCGLDTFGAPSIDQGVAYGQHGRISAAPAQILTTGHDDAVLVVEGLIRQAAHFGENLTLRRRIESAIGSREFTVHDVVTNESSVASPHMIMYHANLGWPVVERTSRLMVPSTSILARDALSQEAMADWAGFTDPTPGLRDQVFLHGFEDAKDDLVRCRVENPRLGLFVELEYDRRELPWLCQWKMMSRDAYVLGIEPVNTPTMVGRADARGRAVLPVLAPGGRVDYRLRFRLGRMP